MVMMGSYWTETQGVGRADLYLTPVCDQDSRIKLFHNFEKKDWTIVIILGGGSLNNGITSFNLSEGNRL